MTRVKAASQRPRLALAVSAIHGKGVFARTFIPSGARVLTCVGIRLHRDQVPDDARAMQIGPEMYLVEGPGKPSLDDFLNHSCDPNLGFIKGSLTLYALRDVAPDEEVVFDYSTSMNEPGWAIRCRCRTPVCRGAVCSYCDLAPRDRRRLRGLALAYLRRASSLA